MDDAAGLGLGDVMYTLSDSRMCSWYLDSISIEADRTAIHVLKVAEGKFQSYAYAHPVRPLTGRTNE